MESGLRSGSDLDLVECLSGFRLSCLLSYNVYPKAFTNRAI